MAPAKRRAAKSASKKPTKAATEDSTEVPGPDGEPVPQEADDEPVAEDAPTGDARKDSAPSTETGQKGRDDRAKQQSQRRPPGYPLPVWPD